MEIKPNMNILKLKALIRKSIPLLIAFVSFVILIFVSISFSNYKKDLREKDTKTRLFELLIARTTKLKIELYSRIHYTRSVAAYVSLKPEITAAEFHNLAKELIQNDSVISTMALSKDCILGAIYPEKGHEAAIGLNLLDHPARRDIVEQTIKTHNTFIAGPVELVEGGIAFISYTPIFDKSKGETDKFWGVTDIVIYKDRLVKDAGLKENELGFLFAIRGQDGLGKNGSVWWGDEKVFEQNPITNEIILPTGSWEIAAVPEKGWGTYLERDKELLTLLLVGSFIISILFWIIGRAVSKNRINEILRHAQLKKSFDLLIESESRFKKLFMEAPLGIGLVESDTGQIIEANPMFAQIVGRTIEEMKHIDWMQITHPDDIQEDLDNMALLNAGKIDRFAMEKRYLHKDGSSVWISMTIAPIYVEDKSNPRHLCMIENITERKYNEAKIKYTNEELQKINAEKDKFFSIIAHDLKGPFNGFLGLTQVMAEELPSLTSAEVQKIAESMSNSAKNLYHLLENLLEWSQIQKGAFPFNPEVIQIGVVIRNSIDMILESAKRKNIEISNHVADELLAFADKNMVQTVIRNLVFNAIKFTPNGGKVSILAKATTNKSIEISIQDNGIGINQNMVENLFRIDVKTNRRGTEGEPSTGLGLLLCKEFTEKNGGKIRVESEVGKGSTFYLTLPVYKSTKSNGNNEIEILNTVKQVQINKLQ